MAEERICLIPFDIDMIIGAQGFIVHSYHWSEA